MNAVSLLTASITFNDVAHGTSFSDWFAGQLSSFTPINVAIALVAALAAGLIISTVYKKTFRGVLYSPSFTMTLILLCLVTTPVVMAIGSNVALSMGMVGALSIVRFRTAVKDPLDTAYMFWAIATGIICGAGYITIAILVTLLLGLLFVGVHTLTGKQKYGSYMIVARYDADSPAEDKLMSLPGFRMKNKSMTAEQTELVGEVRLKDNDPRAINSLRKLPGVHEISLMVSTSGSTL